MEKRKKAKPGPKPIVHNEEVADLFVRDFPIALRNKAKSRSAAIGITLREFVIQALTEKIDATPL